MSGGRDPAEVSGYALAADTRLVTAALTQAAMLGDYFTITAGTAGLAALPAGAHLAVEGDRGGTRRRLAGCPPRP